MLDLAIAGMAWELTGAETCLEAIAAAARRLSRLTPLRPPPPQSSPQAQSWAQPSSQTWVS
jgi:hypothetical protein